MEKMMVLANKRSLNRLGVGDMR